MDPFKAVVGKDNERYAMLDGERSTLAQGVSAAIAKQQAYRDYHPLDHVEISSGAMIVGLTVGLLMLIFIYWCATARRIYLARVSVLNDPRPIWRRHR